MKTWSRDLMEDIMADVPQLRRKAMREAVDDRRFAEACCRVALAEAIMSHARYQEASPTAA